MNEKIMDEWMNDQMNDHEWPYDWPNDEWMNELPKWMKNDEQN